MKAPQRIVTAALAFFVGAFLLPHAVYAYDTTYDISGTTPQNFGYDLGSGTQTRQVAQSWTIPTGGSTYACSVTFAVARNGNPADSLQVKVYRGGSTPDNGTLMVAVSGAPIGVTTVLGSTLSTSLTDKVFTFDNCFPLIAGNKYYFVLSRTGSEAVSSDYYQAGYKTPKAGAATENGWSKVPASGGWVNPSDINWRLLLTGILPAQAVDLPQFPLTASGSADVLCDDLMIGAQELCTGFVWLFYPNPSVYTQFQETAETLQTKIPYSYWYELETAWEGITNASNSNPSIALELAPSLGQASQSLTLFSKETVLYYLPDATLTIFRDLMKWGLWLAFSMFVYRTVRYRLEKPAA